jgi:DNA-directed RNA polymerase subunit RPC12/RpoP
MSKIKLIEYFCPTCYTSVWSEKRGLKIRCEKDNRVFVESYEKDFKVTFEE